MLRGMMSRLALAGLVLAAAAACSSREPGSAKAAPPDPLRDDLDRICNAVTLSGADQDSSAQGTYIMAQWLDANITSAPGREFLVEFARLGNDKAARIAKLEDNAARVGLASCPLVAYWRP